MKNDTSKFFPPEEKNVDNDYKYSRDTYYELVEKGKQSLELMIEVARESEHPRAFEVLSGMIKNISDVNDRLMDLNKKKKEVHEAADAIYHLLVLLEANDIKIEDVLGELKKRQGVSGLVEKANRQ